MMEKEKEVKESDMLIYMDFAKRGTKFFAIVYCSHPDKCREIKMDGYLYCSICNELLNKL